MSPIIIIGMHRSGTSMLTRMLSQAGIFVGKDLDSNHESQFFVKLNEWIFAQAGASWDNPHNAQFIDSKFIADVLPVIKKNLQSSKRKKFLSEINPLQSSKKWAWKDPRNTFTLPIWTQIFPDAKIINIYRNPLDVAISLQKRELEFQKMRDSQTKTGIKKKLNEKFLTSKRIYSQSLRVKNLYEGYKLWEQYTQKSLEISKLNFCYETLLENPNETFAQIVKSLEIEISEEKIVEICKSINSDRKFAFLKNEEHIIFYNKIKNDNLLQKLKYDKIL